MDVAAVQHGIQLTSEHSVSKKNYGRRSGLRSVIPRINKLREHSPMARFFTWKNQTILSLFLLGMREPHAKIIVSYFTLKTVNTSNSTVAVNDRVQKGVSFLVFSDSSISREGFTALCIFRMQSISFFYLFIVNSAESISLRNPF